MSEPNDLVVAMNDYFRTRPHHDTVPTSGWYRAARGGSILHYVLASERLAICRYFPAKNWAWTTPSPRNDTTDVRDCCGSCFFKSRRVISDAQRTKAVRKYNVRFSTTVHGLAAQVELDLADGWELVGGISAEGDLMHQALTRTVQEKP